MARGVESSVVIYHFDHGEWVPLPTSVSFRTFTAWAQVDNLSIFALTINQEPVAAVPLPTQPAEPAVTATSRRGPAGGPATSSPIALPPT
jgi:hypothetical protein